MLLRAVNLSASQYVAEDIERTVAVRFQIQARLRTLKTCVLLFALLIPAACTVGPRYRTLDLSDRGVLPTVRISKNVYNLNAADGIVDPSPALTEGLAVEFGVDYVGGSDSFELHSGEARIGGQTFAGPQLLDTEFDFMTVDVSARWREMFEDNLFGLEASGGLSYVNLGLSVSSGLMRPDESITSPAFRGAVAGFWRMRPDTRLEGFGSVLLTNSNFQGDGRFGVSLVQALGRNVAVHGSYSAWQLDAPGTNRSRIELRFHGPTIGLGLSS